MCLRPFIPIARHNFTFHSATPYAPKPNPFNVRRITEHRVPPESRVQPETKIIFFSLRCSCLFFALCFFHFFCDAECSAFGKGERETAGFRRSTRAPNERWKSHSVEAIIIFSDFLIIKYNSTQYGEKAAMKSLATKSLFFPFSVGFLFLSWLSNRCAHHHVLYIPNGFLPFFLSVKTIDWVFENTFIIFGRNVFEFGFARLVSLFLFGQVERNSSEWLLVWTHLCVNQATCNSKRNFCHPKMDNL